MEYGILWALALLTSLFITALEVALRSAVKNRVLRHLGILAVIGVLTLTLGLVSLLAGLMYYSDQIIPTWLFPYTTSFTLVYVIGACVIWRKGFAGKGEAPPARSWRKTALTFSTFICFVLTWTSYTLIDLDRQIEFTNVNADLKRRLQEVWPSKPLSHLNAYPLYEQASNSLNAQDIDRIFDYAKPDQHATNPEIIALIERNQKVIETIHEASNRPFYYWGSPVSNSLLWLFPFPEYPKYRRLIGLLGLKAKAEVFSGNPADALKELAAIRSMAKHLQSSPDFLSWVLSTVITKQRLEFMEYLLAQAHSANELFTFPLSQPPSILSSLKGVMINESAWPLELPYLMMQKEEVMWNFIRSYNEMYENVRASPPLLALYILKPLPRSLWRVFIGQSYLADLKANLASIHRMTESRYEHWRDFGPLKAAVKRKRQSLVMEILQLIVGDAQNMAESILNFVNQRIILIDVYNQLIDLAIASSAYREAKGSYPENIDDLVPAYLDAVPIDPYDGKPLKMQKVQGGLDLYSVGPVSNGYQGSSGDRKPVHFYLGKEAYERYRAQPARIERTREEERKALEKSRRRDMEVKPKASQTSGLSSPIFERLT